MKKSMQSILIWDLPTRVFHWLFAICFAGAWVTSEAEGWFRLHMLCGVLLLALALFRLVWGFVGGHYARFANFAHSPRAGWDYLRALMACTAPRHVGHNPAGTQAIRMLLALGVAAALSGFAGWALDGEAESVLEAHEILANLMMAVVVLHLAGVAVESRLHRENLARAMVDGHKLALKGTPASRLYSRIGALLLVACVIFSVWWMVAADFAQPLDRGDDRDEDEARVTGQGPVLAACPALPDSGICASKSCMGDSGLNG